MEKHQAIARYAQTEEDRILLARVYDRLTGAQRKNMPASTCFLSKREQQLVQGMLPDAQLQFYGGSEQAERAVCYYVPDYLDPKQFFRDDGPVCAYRATFFEADCLTHRDFLGSLMGLGIKRETVGDIYVGRGTCDFLVLREIAPFLEQNFTSAGRTKLQLQKIALDMLQTPVAEKQEIRDTVSSLRLDAVVCSGFSMSRAKAAEAIARGLVQLNWMVCVKPDKLVALGDVISCRGFGKVELAAVTGRTKKDRIGILLYRYR